MKKEIFLESFSQQNIHLNNYYYSRILWKLDIQIANTQGTRNIYSNVVRSVIRDLFV